MVAPVVDAGRSATRVTIRRTFDIDMRPGDWVEVRSKEEILATLDERGRLDGLIFMPEMFAYCGQRFEVFKSAHKTCDTVNKTGGRAIDNTVHLGDLRCDGSSHGGCGAACLIFWKQAWLRPVSVPAAPRVTATRDDGSVSTRIGATEAQVVAACWADGGLDDADLTYTCQATLLPEATTLLPWWHIRQYWRDWRTGNELARTIIAGGVYVVVFNVIRRANRPWIKLGPPLVRLYDAFQRRVGGVPYPRRWGTIPVGERTPAPPPLNLQPGDVVRVKSYDQILATLDTSNRNRGMFFDAEEVPYCGGTYTVRSLVDKIVDERTGKMIALKGNPVILDNVWCMGHYSDRRMFCPRAIYSFWREAWLERVEPSNA